MAAYWRAFKETREIMMLAKAASVFLPGSKSPRQARRDVESVPYLNVAPPFWAARARQKPGATPEIRTAPFLGRASAQQGRTKMERGEVEHLARSSHQNSRDLRSGRMVSLSTLHFLLDKTNYLG